MQTQAAEQAKKRERERQTEREAERERERETERDRERVSYVYLLCAFQISLLSVDNPGPVSRLDQQLLILWWAFWRCGCL
jgi:septal ring factor EnvC (AmiA/AmiB activator)